MKYLFIFIFFFTGCNNNNSIDSNNTIVIQDWEISSPESVGLDQNILSSLNNKSKLRSSWFSKQCSNN